MAVVKAANGRLIAQNSGESSLSRMINTAKIISPLPMATHTFRHGEPGVSLLC